MWTMGTDFKYQYARTWFRNMDKLIHYVNEVSLTFSKSDWSITQSPCAECLLSL